MALGNGIRSILINGTYLVGSNWIEIVLRAAYVVVITRALGPELYGVWAYVMATYIFAMSGASLGLEALVGIKLGRSKGTAGSDAAAALVLRLAALVVAAIAMTVFVLSGAPAQNAGTALLLILPALFSRSISELIRAMFTGIEQARKHLQIRGVMRACEVVIGIVILSVGGGIWALLVLHTVTWVAEAWWCVLAFPKSLGQKLRGTTTDKVISFLKQGAPLGIAGLLSGWMTAAPLLLYAPVAQDGTTFGAFGLAMQLAMILAGTILGFFGAALPIVSRAVAANDARARSYGPLSAVLGVGLCVVAALTALVIGPQLIDWMFGPAFELTGRLLAPVALLTAAMILPTGFGQSNIVRGVIWPSIVGGILGSTVILLMFGRMVEDYGPVGVIIAAGIGWLLRGAVVIGANLRLSPETESTS